MGYQGFATREDFLRYQKEYYRKNKERHRERREKYRLAHREEHKIASIEYYNRNKDKYREKNKISYRRPQNRYWALISSARQRKKVVEITFEDFKEITKYPCAYCGDENSNYGVDRVNSNQGYIKSNCVSCCKTCNFMKLSLSKEKFISHIRKILNNQ